VFIREIEKGFDLEFKRGHCMPAIGARLVFGLVGFHDGAVAEYECIGTRLVAQAGINL
jgi:hypothetical protein